MQLRLQDNPRHPDLHSGSRRSGCGQHSLCGHKDATTQPCHPPDNCPFLTFPLGLMVGGGEAHRPLWSLKELPHPS